MEHDKGLDLSLGLVVGGSSFKSNEKINGSLEASSNDTDRTIKILSDFRNFLNGGIPQQSQGGYFNNFPLSAINDHASGDQNEEGEKGTIVGDKRKYLYEEVDHNKKQETGAPNSDLLDNAGTSHISITASDGSTADNEDVADSGAETSRLVSNMEDANPQASSEASKELPAKVASSFGVSSTGSDRTKAMIAGNIPMMFGYPHGQLPSLDSDSTWGMVTRHPLLHPYSGRPLSASDLNNDCLFDTVATNHGQSEGEHPAAAKEGSSSRAEDSVKTSNVSVVFRAKPEAETQQENSFPSEYPSIRPGTAADLKFGGAGSLPNLPWVSTTGPGPNGRTISGVTYRFSANEIKIVCACHGLHMSPEDFIQHASDEPPSAATTGALASFPGTSNVAASATS